MKYRISAILFVTITFFFTPLYADECERKDAICIPPTVGEYSYGPPGTTLSDALAQMEDAYGAHPNRPAVCYAKAKFVGTFTGYEESGSGLKILEEGQYGRFAQWYLGANLNEVDKGGVDVTITYGPPECSYSQVYTFPISRFRPVTCPVNYRPTQEKTFCVTFCSIPEINIDGVCALPPKPDPCGTKNPCIPSTGDKVKTHRDFLSQSLSFSRHYNSQQTVNKLSIGKSWRHSFNDKLLLNVNAVPSGYLSQKGRYLALTQESNGIFRANSVYDRVSNISEFELINQEWHARLTNGDKRIYSADGFLTEIEFRSGQSNELTYNSAQQLVKISNNFGHSLIFTYQDGLISSLTQPDGNKIQYEYDNKKNLVSVIYPDLTSHDNTDNPRLVYHYEDPRFDHHLTGITDENGVRHQTYTYNDDGKAVSSEKSSTINSSGQERVELNYLN